MLNMNCTKLPVQISPCLIQSLYAKLVEYFSKTKMELDIVLVLIYFFYFYFQLVNWRIESVQRDFGVSKDVLKLVCSMSSWLPSPASILAYFLCSWLGTVPKRNVRNLSNNLSLSKSTSHFSI